MRTHREMCKRSTATYPQRVRAHRPELRERRECTDEANPNPQLSDEDFAQSALKGGFTYTGLIQRIVNLGLRWEPTRLG